MTPGETEMIQGTEENLQLQVSFSEACERLLHTFFLIAYFKNKLPSKNELQKIIRE